MLSFLHRHIAALVRRRRQASGVATPLHSRSTDFLARLGTLDLFTRVGRHNGAPLSVRVASWPQALAAMHTSEWADACNDSANDMLAQLRRSDAAELMKWNQRVDEIKLRLVPLLTTKLQAAVGAGHTAAPQARAHVEWQLLHICLMHEFSDFLVSGFYRTLEQWLFAGHLACGWSGEVPDNFDDGVDLGRLMVY